MMKLLICFALTAVYFTQGSSPLIAVSEEYLVSSVELDFAKAYATCSRYGFSLATERSAEETAKINSAISIAGHNEKEVCTSMTLKNMKVTVPRAVRAGHSVTLGCEYDLEGAPLYSIKWYRENDEFYRYVPKEEPPIRVFPIQGIRVDVSVSNANNVTLLSVGPEISGQFQCEVSADAPLFHTQLMSTPMTVAVVPAGVPEVKIDKSGLEHGRPLIADCQAPASSPPSNITFFVNDEKVPGYTSEWITQSPDQLEKRTARLELTGVGGSWEPLRIRCEATLFRLYRAKSMEVQVRPDTPHVLLLETTSKASNSPRVPSNPPWVVQQLLLAFVLTKFLAIWLNLA